MITVLASLFTAGLGAGFMWLYLVHYKDYAPPRIRPRKPKLDG